MLIEALKAFVRSDYIDFTKDTFDATDVVVAAGCCPTIANAIDTEIPHARYRSGYRCQRGAFRTNAVRMHLRRLEKKGITVVTRYHYWSFRLSS